jgi:GNAT superfamily N-acetyltransferase
MIADTDPRRTFLLLEKYYDSAPRSAARTEEHGPFTIFVGTGSWPYYARPRLGETHEFTAGDVTAVLERLRELEQPGAIEWVHETTPSLLEAARAAGCNVLEAPLMVLHRASRPASTEPAGISLRILDAEDAGLAAVRAVATVGFAAPGTGAGPQGRPERDAAAATIDPAALEFVRARLRRRLTVTAVAEGQLGPVAAGSHQPVGRVTEVVGVATLPSVRRQGLGAAVTGALVEDALAHGAGTVFISAGSEDIARVYSRLGFRRVGTACIAG